MSWGWFEDHILNSFFSIETKGGKVVQEIRSTIKNPPMFENTEGLIMVLRRPTKCRKTK